MSVLKTKDRLTVNLIHATVMSLQKVNIVGEAIEPVSLHVKVCNNSKVRLHTSFYALEAESDLYVYMYLDSVIHRKTYLVWHVLIHCKNVECSSDKLESVNRIIKNYLTSISTFMLCSNSYCIPTNLFSSFLILPSFLLILNLWWLQLLSLDGIVSHCQIHHQTIVLEYKHLQ